MKNSQNGGDPVRKLLKMTQIRGFYVTNIRNFLAKMRPHWLIQDNKD